MAAIPEIKLSDVRSELQYRRYNRLEYFFPDATRAGYAKHLDFIAGTAKFRESVFCAANRAGKSETGAYAVAVWLTGKYPKWWTGKRFPGAVNILVAGETGRLVRDSIQAKLMGDPGSRGEGMLPLKSIISAMSKSGVPDAVDTVRVKHVGGGESIIQFQSFDQGREAFQATSRDVIWLDEEPPISVYNECLIRTMTTGGIVLTTFTPLKGMSETVLSLRKKADDGRASMVTATWSDAPHLSEADKAELWASLPPYQRDARSKGIPQLGSGAVYPVPESDLLIDPFAIPPHWRKAYGMDVGWNNTAAVWIAHDTEADIVYVTSDYKRGQCEPASHAQAIKVRGDLPGLIDPASQGRGQDDGRKLIDQYRQMGLDLTLADNAVEAGIFDLYTRMTTGRLKIFRTCQLLIEELRLYRRDEKGRIVKENDHICDALRYVCRSGLSIARAAFTPDKPPRDPYSTGGGTSWMGV